MSSTHVTSESQGREGTGGADALTPAMRQYVEQKKRVGEAVLLFRMGDFYETFYDDAVLCSKVLGIALTSRSKESDKPIPLAGIPYHALDAYLKKLVAAGYKVAISEQLEDPKQAKGVVRRDVVRIVTAGTLTDEALLSERDDNILASVCFRSEDAGLALVELAGGRFEVVDVSKDALLDELVRARPAELLIDDERGSPAEQLGEQVRQICGTTLTRRPPHEFSAYQAEQSLLRHFGVATLAGFGFEGMNTSLCAAGCTIQYLQETQKTGLDHITAIRRRAATDCLQIDHSTWRSLEIERTLRGGAFEGTLLWAIDRTVHPIGGRKLRNWIRHPLTDAAAIMRRQDAVSFLVANDIARREIQRRLKCLADIERIAGRVALSRTSPRDLSALGKTLAALPEITAQLSMHGLTSLPSRERGRGEGATEATASTPSPNSLPQRGRGAPTHGRENNRSAFLAEIGADLAGLSDLADLLTRAIREDPPNILHDGGFMADGFDAELDRLRAIGRDGRQWLAEYQSREIERTGIASLKVGFNRVFGYYIEIPNSARERAPGDYVRKQTVKNAERYITDELKKYESDVLTAQERANDLEVRLFEQVRQQVAARIEALMRVADAIGRLDCVGGFAELAAQRRYVRPELVDDGRMEIRDGRHPVLDQTLGDDFVPNDTIMNGGDARVFIITGPNMAGKSTYVRQVALLVLLAQTGSFIPARSMTGSLTDRIFARVGSSDEIMRGQSTFMVEMTEAANILHNATRRSLVVLDELGRGTSTFDGLSLAWAITEHLVNEVRCRALVATHYHELIELSELLRGVRNYNVAVRECAGPAGRSEGIIFLHKIVEGGASKSYGIHVARLAGIPDAVIRRSREVLEELQRAFERESRTPQLSRKKTRDDAQLRLFHEPGEELHDELKKVNPDCMTPLEAMQTLVEWKKRFG